MSKKIEAMPFETAFSELGRILTALENGDLPLEKSIDLYEQGMKLAQHCNKTLDNAELRIKKLSPDGNESDT